MKKPFHNPDRTSNKKTEKPVFDAKGLNFLETLAPDQMAVVISEAFGIDIQETADAGDAKPNNRAERRLTESKTTYRDERQRKTAGKRAQTIPVSRKYRLRGRSKALDKAREARLTKIIRQYEPTARPWMIKHATFILTNQIQADPGPASACAFLRNTRNKLAAATLRRAALGTDENGENRYTWYDQRARNVLAFGVGLFQTARRTHKKGKFNAHVKGIPLGAWCAMLADPFSGKRPHEKTLTGYHRPDGCLQNGRIGYLRALEEAGFCYSVKMPPSETSAHERAGPSGHSCLRYFLIHPDPERPFDDAEKIRLRNLKAAEMAIQREERLYGLPSSPWGGDEDVYGVFFVDDSPAAEPRPPP